MQQIRKRRAMNSRSREAPWPTRQPFTALALRGAFFLALADGATIGGLVGFAGFSAARSAVVLKPMTVLQESGFGNIGSLGMFFGFVALGAYGVWPLRGDQGAVRDRAVVLLCRGLVVLHPAALVALATAVWMFGSVAAPFVFLSLPAALLATPWLLPVGRIAFAAPAVAIPVAPRRSAAPPEADGLSIDPGSQTGPLVALLLPFVAAFRAGLPWLGAMSLILWVGGLVFLLVAPLRGLLLLSLATGIGMRAAQSAARAEAPRPSGPMAPAGTEPVAPPAEAAAGLLCIAPLLTLDMIAGAAAWALARTGGSPENAISVMAGLTIILLVALPFTLAISMVLLSVGTRTTETLRPPLCATLAIAHLALCVFFAALGLRASLLGFGIDAAERVRTLARPMAWALLAGLPLAAVAVLSGTSRRPRARSVTQRPHLKALGR